METNTVEKETGAPVQSSALTPSSKDYREYDLQNNKPLRGFAYARFDDDGEPVVYNPYRRGNLTKPTISVISEAMKALPLKERVEIARNHLAKCRAYHYPPKDFSWALLHVNINKWTLSAGYESSMVPVMDRVRSAFFQRNGSGGVRV